MTSATAIVVVVAMALVVRVGRRAVLRYRGDLLVSELVRQGRGEIDFDSEHRTRTGATTTGP